MNVLFLNPPFHPMFSREQRSPAVTKSGTLYYPKWLAHAAAVAIQDGHNVDFVDAPAPYFNYTPQHVFDRIKAKNIKAVICDTSTPSIFNDLDFVALLKEKHPDVAVLLVGRGVSVMPHDVLKKCKALKYVALREYEYITREWLEAVQSNSGFDLINGMVWKDNNNNIVTNPPRASIHNLDELPFVSEVYKRFLRIEDYYYGHSLHPLVVFDTSRGCPYKCTFCAYPQTFSGHTMRYRSPSNVADEFEYCAKEFPQLKTIMLEDDTFIIDKKRTMLVADELIKRGNKIPFDSNNRADCRADVDFYKRLKQAGARLFCVGFESGDDAVLKHMKKNLNLSKVDAFMKNTRKAGIMVHGCFMVGNLNETKETLESTLALAKRLKPDTAQFFPIMVYPGTAAYKEAQEKGYLTTENYSEWLTPDGLHNSVIDLPNLSHKELVEFCDRARREFYLNPSYIGMKIKQSAFNMDELKRNVKGFTALSKHLVRGSFGGKDTALLTPDARSLSNNSAKQ
jgi:radical SAM superfamily enzyme YgiQ (UPF0313 family)